MVVRRPPFADVPPVRLALLVGLHAQRPPLPPNCPPGVAKLIEVPGLMDAAGRPTIAQTLGFVQTRLGV